LLRQNSVLTLTNQVNHAPFSNVDERLLFRPGTLILEIKQVLNRHPWPTAACTVLVCTIAWVSHQLILGEQPQTQAHQATKTGLSQHLIEGEACDTGRQQRSMGQHRQPQGLLQQVRQQRMGTVDPCELEATNLSPREHLVETSQRLLEIGNQHAHIKI